MRWLLWSAPLVVALLALSLVQPAPTACCYFAAKGKDILQPAQKAFITWDPAENMESFTVQPKFEGNAKDFGMVIPSPAKPSLDPMPREFFTELAVLSILEPMDITKYKRPLLRASGGGPTFGAAPGARPSTVKVVESGVVGSLEYKVITADRADDLYGWLKDNQYNFQGDEATLDFYIQKKWYFTVMKIDPMQMKKRPDGSYDGEVTPTRFRFVSEKLIYPLKITQISVKDKTEALFYVQAPHKIDLPGDFSYECTWVPMWSQATTFALSEKLTPQETRWQKLVQPKVAEYLAKMQALRQRHQEPATLEWAKRITEADLDVLAGKKAYNRQAPQEDIEKLKLLRGHVQKGQFITKLRKVFTKPEMGADLEFVRAQVDGQNDDVEYVAILPTSPP
jgi:hypothetical protein